MSKSITRVHSAPILIRFWWWCLQWTNRKWYQLTYRGPTRSQLGPSYSYLYGIQSNTEALAYTICQGCHPPPFLPEYSHIDRYCCCYLQNYLILYNQYIYYTPSQLSGSLYLHIYLLYYIISVSTLPIPNFCQIFLIVYRPSRTTGARSNPEV